jgi:hypothetical protein
MIYEVIYTQEKYNEFEDYVKNVFKLNFKNDCFIFFYLGENAKKYLDQFHPDLTTAHLYIKELETRFNVNINWIDLSFIFENLNKHNLPINLEDINRVLYYYKRLYFNSIEDYFSLQNVK